MEQLLKESDFVILSCPLVKETQHLINAETLAMMKNTAVLVNIGRGGEYKLMHSLLKEAIQITDDDKFRRYCSYISIIYIQN